MLYPATFSVLPSQACIALQILPHTFLFQGSRYSWNLRFPSCLWAGSILLMDATFYTTFLSFPFSLVLLCFILFFLAVEAIRFTGPCITGVAFVLLCCNFGVSVDLPWPCYLSSLPWGHSHGYLRNLWAFFSASQGKACLRLSPPHSPLSPTHLSVPPSAHVSKCWPTSPPPNPHV